MPVALINSKLFLIAVGYFSLIVYVLSLPPLCLFSNEACHCIFIISGVHWLLAWMNGKTESSGDSKPQHIAHNPLSGMAKSL